MRYQQDLSTRRIAVVEVSNAQWPVLRLHVQLVVTGILSATPGSYTKVLIPG